MASYQNVGTTPRFYIDKGQYLTTINYQDDLFTDAPKNFFYLNPTTPTIKSNIYHIAVPRISAVNYIAFLGTNDGADAVGFYPEWWDGTQEGIGSTASGFQEIVNCNGYNETPEDFDGFSIATFDDQDFPYCRGFMSSGALCGAISIGQYYDMPVAPDLSLSLEHDYRGIKKTTSMSGASFSNANWIKPPKWGDKEAWQLGDFPRPYSGRRIWDLSFSYISDSDLEPRNYTGTTTGLYPGDDNWFENVLHYTMGGHLPFIFQPDKDAVYEPQDAYIGKIPEFAICRFDMNSFSREQVAPGVYNIKIKVKETW